MRRGTLYSVIMFFCMMTVLFSVAILLVILEDNWIITLYPLIVIPLVAAFCWAMGLPDSEDR